MVRLELSNEDYQALRTALGYAWANADDPDEKSEANRLHDLLPKAILPPSLEEQVRMALDADGVPMVAPKGLFREAGYRIVAPATDAAVEIVWDDGKSYFHSDDRFDSQIKGIHKFIAPALQSAGIFRGEVLNNGYAVIVRVTLLKQEA